MEIFQTKEMLFEEAGVKKPVASEEHINKNPTLLEAVADENVMYAGYKYFTQPDFEDDKEYDSDDYDFEAYGENAAELYKAKSAAEVNYIAARLEQDVYNKKKIEEEGLLGTLSLMASSMADPTLFIPIAGASYKASKIARFGAGVAVGATAGVATEIPREIILHANQPARTSEETLFAIGAVGMLSGAISGTMGALSKTKYSDIYTDDEIGALFKNVDDDTAVKIKEFSDEGLSNKQIIDKLDDGVVRKTQTDLVARNLLEGAEYDPRVADNFNVADTSSDMFKVTNVSEQPTIDNDDMYSFVLDMFDKMDVHFNDGRGMRDILSEQVDHIVNRSIAEDVGLDKMTLTLDESVGRVIDDFIPNATSEAKQQVKEFLTETSQLATDKIAKHGDESPTKMITESLDEVVRKMQGGGADGNVPNAPFDFENLTPEELTKYDLKGADWLKWLGNGIGVDIATSKFFTAKKVLHGLQIDGWIRKAVRGKRMNTDTSIKIREANMIKVFNDNNVLYKKYKDRMKSIGEEAVTPQQFRYEISSSLRRGDVHAINEVAAGAKSARKYIDNILQDAIDVGIFTKNVKVKHALSYLPRMYDVDKVIAGKDDFIEMLKQSFDQTLTVEVREMAAEQVYRNVKGGLKSIFESVDVAKPTKERALEVSDEFLERFLKNDYEELLGNYTNNLAPSIELIKTIGDDTGEILFKTIDDEMAWLRSKAKTTKEAVAIDAGGEKAKRDLASVINRLRKTTDNGLESDSISFKVYKTLKVWNNSSALGGVTVSSLPDGGRLLLNNNMSRVVKTIFNPKNYTGLSKMDRVEKSRYVAAIDLHNGRTAKMLADADYGELASNSKYLDGLNKFETAFFKLTGLPNWNAFIKTTSAVMLQGRIHDASVILKKGGKLDSAELKRLYTTGLDDETIIKIGKAIDENPENIQGDVIFADTGKWADKQLVDDFHAVLVNEADNLVITPNSADLPEYMDKWYASMLLQFKSFIFLAQNKIMAQGLQRAVYESESRILLGTSTLTTYSLAALSTQLKHMIKGEDLEDDYTQLAFDAHAVSGVGGWITELDNIADQYTNHQISSSAALGLEGSGYYSSRGKAALYGPTFDKLTKISKASQDLADGDAMWDVMVRNSTMLPFQNHVAIKSGLTIYNN